MRPSSLALVALSLVSGAAALAAGLQGCVLPSFTLDVPDAGSDVAMVPETGPAGCVPATYPDPPGGMDDGNSVGTLVFALRTIDLGDMGSTPGYDLDHVCTCFQDAGPSCTGASSQTATYCDAPGGVDNQAAKLFQLIELPVGPGVFGSAVFTEQANAGKWSLIFQVDGYNGLPDDPAVKVAIFPSKGPGMQPAWDGSDHWPVSATSVGDGGVSNPAYTSDGAYVSGGVLVASMPTSELILSGGGKDTITVRLRAGVITGKLVQLGGPWHLQDGILAGRWALPDVFMALGSYRDDMGMPFCTNQGVSYVLAKEAICQDADILVDGTLPKSTPCNALSIAVGFSADPALLGGISDAGVLTDGCSPATDPSNDSCP